MKSLILLVLLTALLLSGCASNTKTIIIGKVIAETSHNGFMYGIMDYTLLLADNNTYSFKVRDGWILPLNSIVEFRLEHIEKDEFVADSISVISVVVGDNTTLINKEQK